MQKTLPLIITALLLFGGSNLLTTLGIDYKFFNVILLVLSFPVLWMNREQIFKQKTMLALLIFVSLYSIFKLITDSGEGTRMIVLQIISAPVFFAMLPQADMTKDKRKTFALWRKMGVLYFTFYLVEIGLALLERMLHQNIFEHGTMTLNPFLVESSEFRSYSLQGHPLQNALIVSTMMAFVLLSPLKSKYKYSLWGIGYVAILCFNTRSSIVGNALILGAYILYTLFCDKNTRSREKTKLVIFSVMASIVVLFLLFNTGLGGRLINMGLFDEGSAQVRVDVWSIFNYYSLNEFLWGVDMKHINQILYQTGLMATENFWIDFLLKLGVAFLVPYTLLYIYLSKAEYRNYSFAAKVLSSATFILLASTNNSLSASFIPLFVFLVSIQVFDPQYIYYIIPKKYLIERKVKRKFKNNDPENISNSTCL